MVTLSKAAQEAIWGNAAIVRYLEMAREHFEIGERSALFEALCLGLIQHPVTPTSLSHS